MEHHSNQTSWLETIAEVIIINPTPDGLVDLNHLQSLIKKYKDRKLKIASITSCSNVTGIFTPYQKIAQMMHEVNGYCFVDFSSSAPYVDINMHPEEEGASLDAIFFSPHKFLGGPGSSGILILMKNSTIIKHPIILVVALLTGQTLGENTAILKILKNLKMEVLPDFYKQ